MPDLAVANYYSDNISVLRGVGNGTFSAGVHSPAGGYPSCVAIGDLDGDLAPDRVVVNWDNVSVLLNQSLMPGDIDGNGDVDLSDFALFADCMTGPDTGPNPQGCDAFDFDGDLDVDLADLADFQRAFGSIP